MDTTDIKALLMKLIPEELKVRETKLRAHLATLKDTISKLKELGVIIEYTFDAENYMDEDERLFDENFKNLSISNTSA